MSLVRMLAPLLLIEAIFSRETISECAVILDATLAPKGKAVVQLQGGEWLRFRFVPLPS
ncbi:hypothetical protein D3C80_2158390 [compost metagenome]